MRVGVLTTSYPRHDGDVAGIFVRGMAEALAARGHAVDVLAPAPEGSPGLPHPTSHRPHAGGTQSVSLHHVRYAPDGWRKTFYGAGVPDNARHPRAWPGLAGFPLALWREARARVEGWDALISHWALPCALVAGAVRGDRPHLAVLHSADVRLLTALPGSAAWRARVGRSATELLFASAAHRGAFLDGLAARDRADLSGRAHASARGIEPPRETRDRRTIRRELGLGRRFTALALGRLVPIKGLQHAVDAVAGLDDVDLVLAGDGPQREALARRGARLLGTVTGQSKAELLRAVDALVLPSVPTATGRTEGTPTVALEAASYGRAIVASEIGGLPEVFEHERSVLFVRPGDAFGLRRALRRLADDAKLRRRLGRAAQAVAKRYHWPALAPRIEALLHG